MIVGEQLEYYGEPSEFLLASARREEMVRPGLSLHRHMVLTACLLCVFANHVPEVTAELRVMCW